DILSEKHPALHPVVKSDSGYYAILGKLDAGSYGKIKYAQNIETGEIRLFKMQSVHALVKSEFDDINLEQPRRKENVTENLAKTEKSMREYTKFEHAVNIALGQGYDTLVTRKRVGKLNFNSKNTNSTSELFINSAELPRDTQFITLMEYLPGISLEEKIQTENNMSKNTFYKIVLGIMDAIDKVRKAGFNNADIAPSNLKWDESTETVYQFDFGAARPKKRPDNIKQEVWDTLKYAPPTLDFSDDSEDVKFNLSGFIVPTDKTEMYALGIIIHDLIHCVPKSKFNEHERQAINNIIKQLVTEKHADRMELANAKKLFSELQKGSKLEITSKSTIDIKQQVTAEKLLPETGSIYTKQEANVIINKLSNQPDGYFEKKRIGKKSKQESTADFTVQDILPKHPMPRAILKAEGRYFAMLEKIGKGSYAKVKYAQDIKTGEIFAVKLQSTHAIVHAQFQASPASPHLIRKVIGKRRRDQQSQLKIIADFEHEVYKKLGRGVGTVIAIQRPEKIKHKVSEVEGQQDTQFIMVINYVPGISIENIILKKIALTKADFYNLVLGAMAEVENVHRTGYFNADISPGNFKWDQATNQIKQIDFGSARPREKPQGISEEDWEITKLAPGTEGYVDPEEGLSGYIRPNEKTELYALGKIFKQLLELANLNVDEKRYIQEVISNMTGEQNNRLPFDKTKRAFMQLSESKLAETIKTNVAPSSKNEIPDNTKHINVAKRLSNGVSNLVTTYNKLEEKPIRFLTPSTHLGDVIRLHNELEAYKTFITKEP
ncbi:MAG TPA: AarF/UbiB family protein, partial [Gammaproteobacteria bacterium]|nr:AarF/UbiB family protein [Gammaproteobacteria bacterium]